MFSCFQVSMATNNHQVPLSSNEQEFLSKLPYKVTPTNLRGVYSNPVLPDDFDAHSASQHEFTRNGLMFPKPTPSHSPEVHAIYKRMFSSQWLAKDRIIPQSEPHIGKTHVLKGETRKTATTNYNTMVWAGAGQNTKTYTGILGTWKIPTVSKPAEPQGTEGGWNSASWLGIDGMMISNDVLQAGIEQKVDGNGNASYFAWYEWYVQDDGSGLPGYIYETAIPNFPVQPGDEIFCFCYYNGHISGNIIMTNNTNNSHFSITLAPPAAPGKPSPANFNGSSIEWIMEAPDGGEDKSSLPKFTPVTFTNCSACVSGGGSVVPSDCDTLNVENQHFQVLTSATISADSVTINFIG